MQDWKLVLARADQTYEAVFCGSSGFCCTQLLEKTSKIFLAVFDVERPFLVVLAGSILVG